MPVNPNIQKTIEQYQKVLHTNLNFDIVYRTITICGKTAAIFFVDGFCKDAQLGKILDALYRITDANLIKDAYTLSKSGIAYGEVDLEDQEEAIITAILSGQTALFVDGFDRAILIDVRTYPQRDSSEPDKDKVFRGSRDGFVETLVLNTALIRRRIRDPRLIVRHISVGKQSKTDVALCYMEDSVDPKLLKKILSRLEQVKVDALTMNQESMAEILVHRKWYNPLPKFKFTERPDTTAAHILEGEIAVVVDNSPAVLLIPSTIFSIMEEANDYYFPPFIGSYLKLTRAIVMILTVLITPTWILLNQYPNAVPSWLQFILVTDETNVPLLFQILILEFSIDGMKLASLNTPNMLTTSLSVLAAIIVGDYAVQSGWFTAQALLYTAFVALANFSQPGYELGYSLKFMRIFLLITTGIFGLWGVGVWGYLVGIAGILMVLLFSKTVSGRCYLYPLIPFDWKILKRQLFRSSLLNRHSEK